jgi:DNA-binding GntR family transcriptional regulator
VPEVEWQSRVRLVDEVAAVLREAIYAARFPPGTRLRQEELAAQLDISRTPLREAMRILERERLVEVKPGRGVRVVSADPTTLLAAYQLREMVDGLAARLAAGKGDSALVGRLRGLIEQQRPAVADWDPARYTQTNVEFHGAIMEATGNQFVVAQLPLVHMTSRVFAPVAHVDPSRAEMAITEHVGIADAIERGDGDEAERVARAHIRQTIASLPAV